jgi:hypothetical protein
VNVCFMFAGDLPVEIAEVHVMSVRRHIPFAWVIQLADMETPQLRFVDEIRRKEYRDLMDMRFAHQEDLPGHNIILDYDCVVQDDIRDVFWRDFDLAFTRRPEGDLTASQSVREQSPYNLGVIFQRDSGQAFWARVRKGWLGIQDRDSWMDGQVLVYRCAQQFGFNVVELPGETYNYTPTDEHEDVSLRSVVHYKGKRKAWMVHGEEAKAKAVAEGKRVLRIMSGRA